MVPTFAPQKPRYEKCQAADYCTRGSQAAVQSHVHLRVRCEHQTTRFFLIPVSRTGHRHVRHGSTGIVEC